jgi:hypothetical protein
VILAKRYAIPLCQGYCEGTGIGADPRSGRVAASYWRKPVSNSVSFLMMSSSERDRSMRTSGPAAQQPGHLRLGPGLPSRREAITPTRHFNDQIGLSSQPSQPRRSYKSSLPRPACRPLIQCRHYHQDSYRSTGPRFPWRGDCRSALAYLPLFE